jgi:hypothetical protein
MEDVWVTRWFLVGQIDGFVTDLFALLRHRLMRLWRCDGTLARLKEDPDRFQLMAKRRAE